MTIQQSAFTDNSSIKQCCLTSRHLCLRLLVIVALLSSGFSTTVFADDNQRSRAEAVDIAKSRSPDGRVLSVKKVTKNGESVFAVKIISNGRVKVYTINENKN